MTEGLDRELEGLGYHKGIDYQIANFIRTDPAVKVAFALPIEPEYRLRAAIVSLATQNAALREQLTEALIWSIKPVTMKGGAK